MILVGISGITNGGKTKLSKLLLEHFKNSAYICQDAYFYKRDTGKLEFKPELNSHNYDTIEAVDSEKFLADLDSLINNNSDCDFVFVDGFMIYAYDDLVEKFDKKYFFILDKEECLKRRLSRNYKTVGSLEYFEQLVWPNYISYYEQCSNGICKDSVYLNGCDDFNHIFESVKFQLNEIKNSK